MTKYYPSAGGTHAMSVGSSVYFVSSDNLNSTSLVTNKAGAVVAEARYAPYGEVRWTNNALPTDKTYTGQQAEASFELMDYHARYYDLSIMIFTSPDTVIPNPYNPLDWNRYAYAQYNAVNNTDPSGHIMSHLNNSASLGLHQSFRTQEQEVANHIIIGFTYKWDFNRAC